MLLAEEGGDWCDDLAPLPADQLSQGGGPGRGSSREGRALEDGDLERTPSGGKGLTLVESKSCLLSAQHFSQQLGVGTMPCPVEGLPSRWPSPEKGWRYKSQRGIQHSNLGSTQQGAQREGIILEVGLEGEVLF